MQWENTLHAGFSRAPPWLPIADDFQRNNVAAQREDPRSLLTLYRRLIALRGHEPALTRGSYQRIACSAPLLAYRRSTADRRFVVVLNTSNEAQACTLDPISGTRVVLSTHLDREGECRERRLALRADEGILLVTR